MYKSLFTSIFTPAFSSDQRSLKKNSIHDVTKPRSFLRSRDMVSLIRAPNHWFET